MASKRKVPAAVSATLDRLCQEMCISGKDYARGEYYDALQALRAAGIDARCADQRHEVRYADTKSD